MEDYYGVGIWKDTTGQYTDEECDEDNYIEIPVPKDLLLAWFRETWDYDRLLSDPEAIEFGLTEESVKHDFDVWYYEESTACDTDELYGWLCRHGYFWKRLEV